jgi:hypothetical protein
MDLDKNVARIRELLHRYDVGVIHFHIHDFPPMPGEDIRATVDRYVETLGFAPIGDAWREIGAQEALEFLGKLLHRSLAYGVEVMPVKDAESIACAVFAFFPGSSRHFTNTEPVGNGLSWHPITEATSDSGVIIVQGNTVGILWFEDED